MLMGIIMVLLKALAVLVLLFVLEVGILFRTYLGLFIFLTIFRLVVLQIAQTCGVIELQLFISYLFLRRLAHIFQHLFMFELDGIEELLLLLHSDSAVFLDHYVLECTVF